jgi:hypothetical protein
LYWTTAKRSRGCILARLVMIYVADEPDEVVVKKSGKDLGGVISIQELDKQTLSSAVTKGMAEILEKGV